MNETETAVAAMEKSDARLLREYAEGGSEPAFRDLVARHTDFIYSAALRQVESSDIACDIAQSVFTDLARKAQELAARFSAEASLAGWLHRSTRYAALNHLRDTRRRQENERQAMEQLLTDSEATPDWDLIRPTLDEALDSLDDEDREALLLRYFKKRDFRSIGLALGVSDDTAQKRVSRAVDRLREFFSKRGVAVGAGGLAIVISANALQAAPAGLAASISTAALAGTGAVVVTATAATTTVSTATTLQTIAMTTFQKIIVTCAIAAAVGVAVYQSRQASKAREQYQKLQSEQAATTAATSAEIQKLKKERDAAKERAVALTEKLARAEKNPAEVVALRGQVGVLRQEKASLANTSALSKITSDPATRKMIRDSQKMGMSALFGDLSKKLNLTKEGTEQFNDMLADDVMKNIDLITQSLHDNQTPAQIDKLFSGQEAELRAKVGEMLGADGLAQFQDYNKNLLSTLTAAQFKSNLTGDGEAKAQKSQQLSQTVQEETQAALAAAGLPPDFQAIPMLNFRNMASETTADQNLKLLQNIGDRVTSRANGFLSADEITKLQEFWQTAQQNNRAILDMNRKMMAPIVK